MINVRSPLSSSLRSFPIPLRIGNHTFPLLGGGGYSFYRLRDAQLFLDISMAAPPAAQQDRSAPLLDQVVVFFFPLITQNRADRFPLLLRLFPLQAQKKKKAKKLLITEV